jgi:hypothetical protein
VPDPRLVDGADRTAPGRPLGDVTPRTLTFTQAAREFGIQVEDVRALVREGTVWTVTAPGKTRPRVVRDGLEEWVTAGRPQIKRREIAFMPRRVV